MQLCASDVPATHPQRFNSQRFVKWLQCTDRTYKHIGEFCIHPSAALDTLVAHPTTRKVSLRSIPISATPASRPALIGRRLVAASFNRPFICLNGRFVTRCYNRQGRRAAAEPFIHFTREKQLTSKTRALCTKRVSSSFRTPSSVLSFRSLTQTQSVELRSVV